MQSLSRVTFIEWHPACKAFAPVYDWTTERIRSALRRTTGHKATVARWGKLWIRNILKNANRFHFAAGLPHFGSRPTLVACAGPTLRITLQRLVEYDIRPVIVAVSSTITTLRYYDMTPDLVVHTDAGFYSSLHIPRNASFHSELCERSVYAIPLTAAPLPIPSEAATVTVISGNSVCEQVAASALGVTPTVIPEAGTVSATATRLASLVSDGPCFVAGLDLASRDLEHHSRPHSFDSYFSAYAARTNPELSMRFRRSMGMRRTQDGWRTAANLDLYAEWFREHAPEFAETRRLCPSPVDTGMYRAEFDDLRRSLVEWGSSAPIRPAGKAPYSNRRSDVTRSQMILQAWGDEIERAGSSGALARELAEWLGSNKNVSDILAALSELNNGRERD